MKDTGVPAFPVKTAMFDCTQSGMALRDYFAAKAMPAVYVDYVRHADDAGWAVDWRDGIARDAYKMADAMLKARQA